MDNKVLTVKNLQTSFYTTGLTIKAVRGVSFSLKKGEILGVVGESGSGKSVMCLSILKLIPVGSKIVSGDIIINGENIKNKGEEWVRKNIRGKTISMILQDPLSALNPTYTIGWQMKEALLLNNGKGLNKEIIKRILIDSLISIGMPDPENILDKYPHQLSGGMRQRIIIATAILAKPDIIIADEPTTALDVTIEARILDVLVNLRENMNLSLIIISHDLNLITERCDNTAVMYGGVFMEFGKSLDVFERPLNPYTYGLLKCTPSLEDSSRTITPIPGDAIDLAKLPTGCPFHPRCFRKLNKCEFEMPEIIRTIDLRECRCFNPIKYS